MKLKPLAPDQEASLRLGAVQRILASEAVPAQHLRSSVLAALASRYHLLHAPQEHFDAPMIQAEVSVIIWA